MPIDEILNTQSELKNELRNIWNKDLYKNFCTYKPLAPEKILKNSLLFIGINPSRSKDETTPETNENRCEVDFYSLDQKTANYPYFKKFVEISKHCNMAWTHLDLFYFRETNQNTINDILNKENGLDFICEQLQITKKLIEKAEAKVIIVSNALAAKFLGRDKKGNNDVWLGYDFVFDEKIGTHLWNNTPVFFTSMLTGQRALDNGSYERLKWHIKQSLNFKE